MKMKNTVENRNQDHQGKSAKDFESAMARLEEIVRALENDQVPLGESLDLYAEGVSLVNFCSGLLDEADRRVSILKRGESGEIEELPFDGEEN